jgi:hypothetical protein
MRPNKAGDDLSNADFLPVHDRCYAHLVSKPERRDLEWAAEFERVSRRAILGMGGAIGIAAFTGLSLDLGASPAFALGPPNSADAIALARSCVGYTLAQLQASVMTVPPWSTYADNWCAVFGSWIVSGTGIGFRQAASALYGAATAVSSPSPGDIIWYPEQTGTDGHVGIVADVVGSAVHTIEGNTHNKQWQLAQVSAYNSPLYPIRYFSRPNWGSAPPPTTSYLEDDLTDMLYYVTGSTTYTTNGVKTPAVAVVPDSVWYQERPGSPLFYVAASAGASAEYSAFLGARFSNANAGRCAVPANQLGALIELRGQSLQPAATLAPLRT